MEVFYCGICHTDIHQVGNEWGNTIYPCMPGHEMTGTVRRVGASMTRHAVGNLVGIGCMIDSCGTCEHCREGDENYCECPNGMLQTYNGPVVPAETASTGTNIYGRDKIFVGYSDVMVVLEDFVLKVPSAISAAKAAPILCAGVTTYSPLKHWGVGPGKRVGVVGLGGLGHMAVKLARAMGAKVTVITTARASGLKPNASVPATSGWKRTPGNRWRSLRSRRAASISSLSTVPQKHDINPYVVLLKRDAAIVVVGAMEPLAPVNNQAVAFHRRHVCGSFIGSIREMQEVFDFCAEHGVRPEIEIVAVQDVNEAHRRIEGGDARFRYVISLVSLKEEKAKRAEHASAIHA